MSIKEVSADAFDAFEASINAAIEYCTQLADELHFAMQAVPKQIGVVEAWKVPLPLTASAWSNRLLTDSYTTVLNCVAAYELCTVLDWKVIELLGEKARLVVYGLTQDKLMSDFNFTKHFQSKLVPQAEIEAKIALTKSVAAALTEFFTYGLGGTIAADTVVGLMRDHAIFLRFSKDASKPNAIQIFECVACAIIPRNWTYTYSIEKSGDIKLMIESIRHNG